MNYQSYLIYSVVLASIVFFIYQLTYKDYTPSIDYFADYNFTKPQQILITIKDLRFNPKYINVPIGTTLTWINLDKVTHGVRGKSQNSLITMLESPSLGLNQTYSYKVKRLGKYSYHCPFHPQMKASFDVTDDKI